MLAVPIVTRGILREVLSELNICEHKLGITPAKACYGRLRLLTNSEGPTMLRVETQELDGALMCRLEGRFTGEQAEHVRMLVTQCHTATRLVADLTEVIYVDVIGEDVLLLLKKMGAQFLADTSYSRDVCERLDLPQASRSNV
jgi:hypothetical protein